MKAKKKAIVLGAGGFIGSHLVKRLKQEGLYVKGIDIKHPEFSESAADEFIIGDLRDIHTVQNNIDEAVDEVYQLAGDVGGAGYIFTGLNDANVMHNSAQINLNVAKVATEKKIQRLFFSSSACIYPAENQTNPETPNCEESSAYPANPDSEYGWEKLMSERLYLSYKRNFGLNVKIARFHNIYGPESTWKGGKEKAPAAICRKVAEAGSGQPVEIWGDGLQTRSFLYIDDCLDATIRLMRSDYTGPYNIGSEEMISMLDFTKLVLAISSKTNAIKTIHGPVGVRGRCSHNRLIENDLQWSPVYTLETGVSKLYQWINQQVNNS
ncbi:MAG: NAD-dependent epimerase/dehydratase family protein [Crocinitomicaceae bacterium]|nr:NAD-dependent epimerase/dehydratase family protein [Crocinitomicaceae bacterium]NGF76770.1 NAD-dependent epimerase/dehydratase family protein [Fluviicola sp. SGL-29]